MVLFSILSLRSPHVVRRYNRHGLSLHSGPTKSVPLKIFTNSEIPNFFENLFFLPEPHCEEDILPYLHLHV